MTKVGRLKPHVIMNDHILGGKVAVQYVHKIVVGDK